MKLTSFSKDLCQRLLDMGYTHFVLPKAGFNELQNTHIHIFEAVHYRPVVKSIPIRHIMDLPERTTAQYFVAYNDPSDQKEATK